MTFEENITDVFTIERSSDEDITVTVLVGDTESIISPLARRMLSTTSLISEQYSINNAEQVTVYYRAKEELSGSSFKITTQNNYSELSNGNNSSSSSSNSTNTQTTQSVTDSTANATVIALIAIFSSGICLIIIGCCVFAFRRIKFSRKTRIAPNPQNYTIAARVETVTVEVLPYQISQRLKTMQETEYKKGIDAFKAEN